MARRFSNRTFIGVGIAVSLFLAGVVSYFASSSPDGLERVGSDIGFIDTATPTTAPNAPLAGYQVTGISHGITNGLAGVIGVVAVGAVAFLLFRYLGRGRG